MPQHYPFASLADEVHVWCVRLDLLTSELPAFLEILSTDEQTRAARFHFQRDSDRYVVRRGVLRYLLGRYLQVEPGAVHFRYRRFGKPALDPAHHPRSHLTLSLAHSQDIALFAFAPGSEIGIDVEYVKPLPDLEKIAAQAFSENEQTQLAALPDDERTLAFYHGWTRKEAYLKALGRGLSQSLDRFSVSIDPGKPARLLHVVGRADDLSHWSLESWAPSPGYVAALAVEGKIHKLRHQRLPALDAKPT